MQADQLLTEEKTLKKAAKVAAEALHLKTKATIEQLSDAQVNHVLQCKWIAPLLLALAELPTRLIAGLTREVQQLADKYATTYADIDTEIAATERELSGLLGELTGDAFDMQAIAEFQRLLGEG